MVASRIRCIVVEMPALAESVEHRLRRPARELLPWADPYIASLIRKLQNEVRQERAQQRATALQEMAVRQLASRGAVRDSAMCDEAPPPSTCSPIEFEVPDDRDWPLLHDVPADDDAAGR